MYKLLEAEKNVKKYPCPDVLTDFSGEKIDTVEKWEAIRKNELKHALMENIYGHMPSADRYTTKFEVVEEGIALNDTAKRKQVKITVATKKGEININLLLYTPLAVENAPVILGINFRGNFSVHPDENIIITEGYCPGLRQDKEPDPYLSIEKRNLIRGHAETRWNVETIINRGFAIATYYDGDVDPDFDDGFKNGIHPLFYKDGQECPEDNEWGTISAWAFGMHRCVDYLMSDEDINNEQIAVTGLSRMGKTSLLAGALDERIAVVCSVCSGCGGSSLFRREAGESLIQLNKGFPHWLNKNARKFEADIETMPTDQHELMALCAPRPLYIMSATEDSWADPIGELASANLVSSVYELYGYKGIETTELPGPGQVIGDRVAYHIRPGYHMCTGFDWNRMMDFCEKHYK